MSSRLAYEQTYPDGPKEKIQECFSSTSTSPGSHRVSYAYRFIYDLFPNPSTSEGSVPSRWAITFFNVRSINPWWRCLLLYRPVARLFHHRKLQQLETMQQQRTSNLFSITYLFFVTTHLFFFERSYREKETKMGAPNRSRLFDDKNSSANRFVKQRSTVFKVSSILLYCNEPSIILDIVKKAQK